jgi:hypothetical protein
MVGFSNFQFTEAISKPRSSRGNEAQISRESEPPDVGYSSAIGSTKKISSEAEVGQADRDGGGRIRPPCPRRAIPENQTNAPATGRAGYATLAQPAQKLQRIAASSSLRRGKSCSQSHETCRELAIQRGERTSWAALECVAPIGARLPPSLAENSLPAGFALPL